MGLRLKKSINLGGGARINLSKSGIGGSIGTKGLRYTKTSNGRTRSTMSIPGTGLSYVSESGKGNKRNSSKSSTQANTANNSSKFSVNEDGTINIRNNTYRIGLIKFVRTLLFFVSILFLLMSPISPFLLLISVFFGFNGYNYSKMVKAHKKAMSAPKSSTTLQSNHDINALFTSSVKSGKNASDDKLSDNLTFNVSGVSMENDKNKDIQSIIKRIVADIKENLDKDDLYEGKSNAEIKDELEFDSDSKIFELDFETIDDIRLILEPSNPYDPNAIKVVSDEYGHLGYVPKGMTKKVRSRIEQPDFEVTCTIVGGKYKYYDDDEEKVLTDSLTYGLEIEIR